jgi:hypothetical protein
VKAEVPSVTGDEARCSTDLLFAVHFGPVPVPAPDTGKTKTGRLWTYKGGRRRAEFAPDSALKGAGLEPSVPRMATASETRSCGCLASGHIDRTGAFAANPSPAHPLEDARCLALRPWSYHQRGGTLPCTASTSSALRGSVRS